MHSTDLNSIMDFQCGTGFWFRATYIKCKADLVRKMLRVVATHGFPVS